jgi:hypothetical protein
MGVADKYLSELKEKIAERERFLQAILDFCDSVVLKYGIEIEREERKDHIKTVLILKDFNGFDIEWCLGRSNHINIFYPPRLKVLAMTYWMNSTDKFEVTIFNDSAEWQEKLVVTMSNSEEILKNLLATKAEIKEVGEKVRREREELERLKEKAKRLKLT